MTKEEQIAYITDWIKEKILFSDEDREVLIAAKQALEEQKEDKGEISDGYHTFNQLYHQRAVLFAAIVNQNKDKAWKSWKHLSGRYCFDSNGEWFIVGVDTPEGSYTYHYSKEYWHLFKCQELEYGKEWDGHTEEDVTRLLSLEGRKEGKWIRKLKPVRHFICSNCNAEHVLIANFCSICGMKVIGYDDLEQ